MRIMQSRRDFLAGLSAAGAAGAVGHGTLLVADGPPEVTTIRLRRDPSICIAPLYITEDLLRPEGFTESSVREYELIYTSVPLYCWILLGGPRWRGALRCLAKPLS